jgi:hypothetical protein
MGGAHLTRLLCVPLALLALLAGCGSDAARSAPLPVKPSAVARSGSSHIVVVVMENKESHSALSASDSPYLTGLAQRYAQVPESYGVRHPSLPNYLALTSGSTHGITDNCTGCRVDAPNIVDQLEQGRIAWKGYMEGMPRPCFTGASAGRYKKKHNPFVYYDSVTKDPARCRKVVPYSALARDLRAGTLPTVAWVTPDMCNDTHDCSVRTGDRFLSHLVPLLLRGVGPRGFVVVTYDEGKTDTGCCGGSAGGRIATVVAGPTVRRGFRHTGAIDHYGVLGTIEDALGLPALGGARDPESGRFTDVFTSPPRVP